MTAEKIDLDNEELVELYLKTNDNRYFDYLVTKNTGLFWTIIFRVSSKMSNAFLTQEDLFQLSVEGMYSFIRRYDRSKGFKFSTFLSSSVYFWLINCIKDESTTFKIPRKKLSEYFRLLKIPKEKRTQKEKDLVREVGNARIPASLSSFYQRDEYEGESLEIAWDYNLEQEIEEKLILEDIFRLLDEEFEPREKEIIVRNLLEHQTLREIGNILNLSRERIRQLRNSSVKKLRIKMRKLGYDLEMDG